MKFDTTITLSIIVAVIAIIAPLLTTLINNHHQLKVKKLELKQLEIERNYLHKRTIIENAIASISKCIGSSNNTDSEAILLACSYVDDKVEVAILNVFNHIRKLKYCDENDIKLAIDSLKSELVKLDSYNKAM